ncbi:monoglyceride lipase, putative [Trypanosoma equiperdum]|uniref:Monoglyceride lipase, putative n=2 Tax=Trypanozoon TaxID=39700 RepID=A0A1G4I233_TRYEQ|nr:monoglyceride lipase [Trypanosoma brucei equiperdum]SCU65760.1 monoglyceride lipase, putative [Trypanosoma equiperdum]
MGCCSCCIDENHDLKYATPDREPPDPELFPHYLQNKQGLWLHFTEWAPPRDVPNVRGVLFVVSGLGEHTARYGGVGRYFSREGYHVFCMDNQGAGASEGERLYVVDFEDFVDDIFLFRRRVFSLYPEYAKLPRFLLGHSMGGLIATHVSLRDPTSFAGVVLSGPALEPDPKIATPFKRWLVGVLSNCAPKFGVDSIDPKLASTNRQVVELMEQDPVYFKVKLTTRWAKTMLDAMESVWEHVERATYPLLIVHGAKDALCPVSGSRRLFSCVPTTDKQLIEYPGLGHEVLTEVRWREVLGDILKFLNAHCQ